MSTSGNPPLSPAQAAPHDHQISPHDSSQLQVTSEEELTAPSSHDDISHQNLPSFSQIGVSPESVSAPKMTTSHSSEKYHLTPAKTPEQEAEQTNEAMSDFIDQQSQESFEEAEELLSLGNKQHIDSARRRTEFSLPPNQTKAKASAVEDQAQAFEEQGAVQRESSRVSSKKKRKRSVAASSEDSDYYDEEGELYEEEEEEEMDHDYEETTTHVKKRSRGNNGQDSTLSKAQHAPPKNKVGSKDDRECCICHDHIPNKWQSVWVTEQNVDQYKECFGASTGFDGSKIGRACRTCYNRYFAFINAKKYSNVDCICCLKPLSKRSYPFNSFAHIYRTLFPHLSEGTTEGRVCTTCYDKGYNARQGIIKEEAKAKRSTNRTRSSNTSTQSQDLDYSEASIPAKRTRRTTVQQREKQEEENEDEYDDDESHAATNGNSTKGKQKEDDTGGSSYITRARERTKQQNLQATRNSVLVHLEVIPALGQRLINLQVEIERGVHMSDLHQLLTDSVPMIKGEERIVITSVEYDRIGEQVEVLLTQRCLKKFPLTDGCKLRAYIYPTENK